MLDFIISFIIIYALIIMLGSTDTNTQDGDYLIVLGSGLVNNQISLVLKQRCDEAIVYLNKNPNTIVVVSGGYTNHSNISEASVMKQYLVEHNIVESRIIVEDKALDTVDNINYSFKLIDTTQKVVILSNNYHLTRAKMIGKMYGVNCKAVGINTPFIELIKHLLIEEIFIVKNYLRIKKDETI